MHWGLADVAALSLYGAPSSLEYLLNMRFHVSWIVFSSVTILLESRALDKVFASSCISYSV